MLGFRAGPRRMTVYRTRDGGTTWDTVLTDIRSEPHAVQFLDERNGWAVAHRSWKTDQSGKTVLLKTRNGGRTWVSSPLSGHRYVEAMHWTDSACGYVVTAGKLLRTRDGGATWSPENPHLRGVKAIHFLTRDSGWATDGGFLYRTSDGGASWRDSRGAENGMSDFFFLPSGEGWAVGSEGTVLRRAPDGKP